MQDPIGAFERIRALYVSYLDTAFRIGDEVVAKERRRLLIQPGSLCTEPLVEPIPRYEAADIALDDLLEPKGREDPLEGFSPAARRAFVELLLAGLFPSRPSERGGRRIATVRPYRHQISMLQRGLSSGTPGIVTSGTGSGKTESFLLPILARIAQEAVTWPAPNRDVFLGRRWWHTEEGRPYAKFTLIPIEKRPTSASPLKTPFVAHRDGEHKDRRAAVRALILYPMNALVEDQMVRLRRALDSREARAAMDASFNGNRIFFGRYTGQTPVPGHHDHPGLHHVLAASREEVIGQSTYFPDHKNADRATGLVELEDVRDAEKDRRVRQLTKQFDAMVEAEGSQLGARLFALDAASQRSLRFGLAAASRDSEGHITSSDFLRCATAAGKREAGALHEEFRREVGRRPSGDETEELDRHVLTVSDGVVAGSTDGDDAPFLFPSTDGGELIARWDMQAQPPDVLITNVSMLSAMLNREVDAPIFTATRKWLTEDPNAYFFLVLDELHLHRGSAGTEVSYLIRSLLHRLGLTDPAHRGKLRILASSASLPDSPEVSARESATFLWDMFGPFGLGDSEIVDPESGKADWRRALVPGKAIAPRYDEAHAPDRVAAQPFLDLMARHIVDPNAALRSTIYAAIPEAGSDVELAWLSLGRALGAPEGLGSRDVVKHCITETAERIALACWENDTGGGRFRPLPTSEICQRLFSDPHAPGTARALMFVRGAGDGLTSWLGSWHPPTSFRVHTFFRSIEGLYAPAVANLGIPDLDLHRDLPIGRLSIEREPRLEVRTPDGRARSLRVFELIYCEACGDLFIAGMKAFIERGRGLLAELLPHEPSLDGLPDATSTHRFEDLSWDQFGVFWPAVREPKPDPRDSTAKWIVAALNAETGEIRRVGGPGGLDRQDIASNPDWVIGRYYERGDSTDRHSRKRMTQGTAVPYGCPACGTSYALRSDDFRLSPLRNFRVGFGKTTQLLATELFDAQRVGAPGVAPKLVSFSDSRQDAAKAALDVERNHHQDLRRELLVLSLEHARSQRGDLPALRSELLTVSEQIEMAMQRRDRETVLSLDAKEKALKSAIANALEPAVRLSEILEWPDLALLGKRDLPVLPYIASLVARGIHPSDPTGQSKLRGTEADKDHWYDWVELFVAGEEVKWRDDEGPGPNHARRTTARHNLVTKVVSSLVDVVFSRTYFSLEASGLGYATVCGVDAPGATTEHIAELSAVLRVMADTYRFDPNPYRQDGDEDTTQEWTSLSDVTARFRDFAKASWREEAAASTEAALTELSGCGHSHGIINISKIAIRLSEPEDPYYRCDSCGRVHLHRGTGICTRCLSPLPSTPSGKTATLIEENYLGRRLARARSESNADPFDAPSSFRLHCEELTGQTDDPASRQRAFKGIFIPKTAEPEDAEDEEVSFDFGDSSYRKRDEVDLLTVTTTMEVGVDIGSLQAVLQANMPPQRFNYQQRVGRAGRRGQAFSMALTICRTRSHDLHYFRHPKKITGDIPPTPFLTKRMANIARRFVRKAWLNAAFARVRDQVRSRGEVFPADLMTPPDIHGEFMPRAFWHRAGLDWKSQLRSELTTTKIASDEIASALTEGGTLRPEDVRIDGAALCAEIDVAATEAQVAGLAHALAETGLLPLYGMPTRVRELYLALVRRSGRYEWKTVDRDLDLAIYEFAPGSSVVVDKKEHLAVGFTPNLTEPRLRRGGELVVFGLQDDALGPEFRLVECGRCHAWHRTRGGEEDSRCDGCGGVLDLDQAKVCRVPAAFRTNFKPRVIQEDADSGVRHRSIQAEAKAPSFRDQRIPIHNGWRYDLAFDESTITFRLNRGPDLAEAGQAFDVVRGEDSLRNMRLPAQVVSTESRLKPGSFQPREAPERIWLAAPKVTDSVYLRPSCIPAGLSMHRLPARSHSPLAHQLRWLGVRAAALSASYLLVNGASLSLDVDPEEFDVIEPRLLGAEVRLPMLQFTDHLVNGAGYSRALTDPEAPTAPLTKLIASMLSDSSAYPLADFMDTTHSDCQTACYRCLLRYGNQPLHGLLDWQLGLTYLRATVDPHFRCGLDGDFESPGLTRWTAYAERLASTMAQRFAGATRRFAGIPAFTVGLGRGGQSPWVLVAHPLWDWDPDHLDGTLSAAFDEALEAGPAAPLCWDTFNLERRQVRVRESIREAAQGR